MRPLLLPLISPIGSSCRRLLRQPPLLLGTPYLSPIISPWVPPLHVGEGERASERLPSQPVGVSWPEGKGWGRPRPHCRMRWPQWPRWVGPGGSTLPGLGCAVLGKRGKWGRQGDVRPVWCPHGAQIPCPEHGPWLDARTQVGKAQAVPTAIQRERVQSGRACACAGCCPRPALTRSARTELSLQASGVGSGTGFPCFPFGAAITSVQGAHPSAACPSTCRRGNTEPGGSGSRGLCAPSGERGRGPVRRSWGLPGVSSSNSRIRG